MSVARAGKLAVFVQVTSGAGAVEVTICKAVGSTQKSGLPHHPSE